MAIKRIILHLGPGKCGSSSIQAFMAHLAKSDPGVSFRKLNPALIASLNSRNPPRATTNKLAALLALNELQDTILVLSHEVLFQTPRSVGRIARLAGEYTDDVRVVGYSRRPSDFIQSVFCQWLFRSPERLAEDREAVSTIGMRADAFSAVERHYIAAIATDFHTARQLSGKLVLHWGQRYKEIETHLAGTVARLSVGQLPSDVLKFSLLADFAERCGGFGGDALDNTPEEKENQQFDMDIVEAVSIAIENGLAMPDPHSENALLASLSRGTMTDISRDQLLLRSLRNCVDSLLSPESEAFAVRYGLSPGSFSPRETVSKADMMLILRNEQCQRLADPTWLAKERDRVLARITEAYLELGRSVCDRNA